MYHTMYTVLFCLAGSAKITRSTTKPTMTMMDNVETQPIDIMEQVVQNSPPASLSPGLPTAVLRKKFQGVSPPPAPPPAATPDAAVKQPLRTATPQSASRDLEHSKAGHRLGTCVRGMCMHALLFLPEISVAFLLRTRRVFINEST